MFVAGGTLLGRINAETTTVASELVLEGDNHLTFFGIGRGTVTFITVFILIPVLLKGNTGGSFAFSNCLFGSLAGLIPPPFVDLLLSHEELTLVLDPHLLDAFPSPHHILS